MSKFKVGDLVTVFSDAGMFNHPHILFAGRIVKRVHPTCYNVERTDMRRGYIRKGIHPADMLHNDGSAEHRQAVQDELKRRVKAWEDADPARKKAYEEHEASCRRAAANMTKMFNEILGRTYGKRRR